MSAMDKKENNYQPVEVRRGGLVQYFVYLPLFVVLGLITTQLSVPITYRYMSVAVLSVGIGYYLQPYIFRKPVIMLFKDGIFTEKLGKVVWKDVRDIQLEKTTLFSAGGLGRTQLTLVIETNQDKKDSFNADFLNVNIQQFCDLINDYRNISKTNI